MIRSIVFCALAFVAFGVRPAFAQLQLTVDRGTGESQISNLTTESVGINGYGVFSPSGLLTDANWQPMTEGGPWVGNSSNTHVSELSITGFREFESGTNAMLGAIYNFQPTELGEVNEDVFFEYNVDGGDVVQGFVDFAGPHHDVVLVVADDGAYIQNQSSIPLEINGYGIVSEAGSLAPDNWTSLADGGDGWVEANAASNHITELNLGQTMMIPASSDPIPLGAIVVDGAGDLEFVVNLAGTGPHTGTVEYDDGVIDFGGSLCDPNTLGDIDGSGRVDFLDFLGLASNFGQPATDHTTGDIDCSGDVSFLDFLVIAQNFGQAVGEVQPVPEPSAGSLLLFSAILLIGRPRTKR